MVICGVKLTHDGGLAILEDRKLLFSVEIEKLENNRRYKRIDEIEELDRILTDAGIAPDDIDCVAVDGWHGGGGSERHRRVKGEVIALPTAGYFEASPQSIFQPTRFGQIPILGQTRPYESYVHVSGHLAAAWCTSPFAISGGECLCLVWDGAIFPRLYLIDPENQKVEFCGDLFYLVGIAYTLAGLKFGPFGGETNELRPEHLGVGGKLMAYIALGSSNPSIVAIFRDLYQHYFESDWPRSVAFRSRNRARGSDAHLRRYLSECAKRLAGVPGADVLASFHIFIESMLLERLSGAIKALGRGRMPICLTGGCALNIKWNSAIRGSGLFSDVWVPPFPNDSGGAIGVACCAEIARHGLRPISWDVRSGPELRISPPPDGWRGRPCDEEALARILADGHPVVLLSGSAELGPRALGGRSILARATDAGMKDHLNDLKKREAYRPVAPICLEDRAPSIFDPGSPDPFMLFDHAIREDWKSRIPAVAHLDGTARLQTVRRDDDTPRSRDPKGLRTSYGRTGPLQYECELQRVRVFSRHSVRRPLGAGGSHLERRRPVRENRRLTVDRGTGSPPLTNTADSSSSAVGIAPIG